MKNNVWTMNTDRLFRRLSIIKTTKRLPPPKRKVKMNYANMLRTKVDNTLTKKDQTDKDKLTLLHKRLFHRGRYQISDM